MQPFVKTVLALSLAGILGACATASPPLDLAAQEARLAAKQRASTAYYPGITSAQAREAAGAILLDIDDGFAVSLSEKGLSAGRLWSSYIGLANLVGADYWVIRTEEDAGGTAVFVNAVVRSGARGPFQMALPDSNGLPDDLPLSSELGLTVPEMDLFHRRLKAKLLGQPWETCDAAFGRDRGAYPLTCNRGGLTTYF